ncbi:Thiol-disulfide isomerase or thioredoxin [Salinimicrobium catena]|uniref:Thiol-disulfide isomerase or thioredoxin n=1 Tax=Salinimicrobium catena TaxID=390640 RepID=A0A1H5MQY4_9FLAO|nr:TlpA disulfide reductase family protein [Salinimicrobium catena]SDL27934.1 Thiol-disulfide isomerase or thioredoxin [Salinimicrobium catena]SEE91734.1 Thiol-disulfide isomerase or thioredoxin [Salinimicrobium catena]
MTKIFRPISKSQFLNLGLIFAISSMLAGCGESEKEFPDATFQMEMKNSKGEQVSMEEFKGKVIFFNVWATWCAPCIEEMPTIHNLYKEVKDREDVEFLMLSMDQDFEKAIEFREKYDYEFEIYRLTGPMPAMYHTKLIPTTFIINSEGKLVLQHDGMGEFDSGEFKEYFSGIK